MIHILSIEQSFLTKGEGTAVCSCGKREGVTGAGFEDLLAAGQAWHVEHVATPGTNGHAESFTRITDPR